MQPVFLVPEQCCLYIIDPQERLMARIYEAERVEANISRMIHLAKILKIPIIANTQYKKGIGPIVPNLATLLTDVDCPDKLTFNGLADDRVQSLLKRLSSSINTLLLCGVETHICIYQTAVGALQSGYQVTVVADAVSSRTPGNDRVAQERMAGLGVVLKPAEMIIYELLQKAGTPEFKAMLPYLK